MEVGEPACISMVTQGSTEGCRKRMKLKKWEWLLSCEMKVLAKMLGLVRRFGSFSAFNANAWWQFYWKTPACYLDLQELWSHKDEVIAQLSSHHNKVPKNGSAGHTEVRMLWLYSKHLNRIWFQFIKSSLEQLQTSWLQQNIINLMHESLGEHLLHFWLFVSKYNLLDS